MAGCSGGVNSPLCPCTRPEQSEQPVRAGGEGVGVRVPSAQPDSSGFHHQVLAPCGLRPPPLRSVPPAAATGSARHAGGARPCTGAMGTVGGEMRSRGRAAYVRWPGAAGTAPSDPGTSARAAAGAGAGATSSLPPSLRSHRVVPGAGGGAGVPGRPAAVRTICGRGRGGGWCPTRMLRGEVRSVELHGRRVDATTCAHAALSGWYPMEAPDQSSDQDVRDPVATSLRASVL